MKMNQTMLYLALAPLLGAMAAYALRAPYPGKGPPKPPSSGAPDQR